MNNQVPTIHAAFYLTTHVITDFFVVSETANNAIQQLIMKN